MDLQNFALGLLGVVYLFSLSTTIYTIIKGVRLSRKFNSLIKDDRFFLILATLSIWPATIWLFTMTVIFCWPVVAKHIPGIYWMLLCFAWLGGPCGLGCIRNIRQSS